MRLGGNWQAAPAGAVLGRVPQHSPSSSWEDSESEASAAFLRPPGQPQIRDSRLFLRPPGMAISGAAELRPSSGCCFTARSSTQRVGPARRRSPSDAWMPLRAG